MRCKVPTGLVTFIKATPESGREGERSPGIWGKEAALSMGTRIPSTGQMNPEHHRSSFFIFLNVLPDPRSSCPPWKAGSLQVNCTDGKPRLSLDSCPLPSFLPRALLSTPTQVLVLSSGSRKSSAAGDVVNLVSVDIQRLTESVLYLNALWLLFLWISICFIYLWQVRSRGRGFELPSSPLPSGSSSSSSGSCSFCPPPLA